MVRLPRSPTDTSQEVVITNPSTCYYQYQLKFLAQDCVEVQGDYLCDFDDSVFCIYTIFWRKGLAINFLIKCFCFFFVFFFSPVINILKCCINFELITKLEKLIKIVSIKTTKNYRSHFANLSILLWVNHLIFLYPTTKTATIY